MQHYRDLQDDESKVTTCDLLNSPDNYVAHFERYATSVVSIIGFGRRIANTNDPLITEVIDIMHRAAELAVPGKTFPRLMETFPGKPIPTLECVIESRIYADRIWNHSLSKVSELDGSLEAWPRPSEDFEAL